jgi:hypothetical protein
LAAGAGGALGSATRRSSTQRSPRRAAASAVARQWFDCSPPQVITVSAWRASASASRYSSLRTLLPDSSAPVRSSRFHHRDTPRRGPNTRDGSSGVGSRASDRRGGGDGTG